MAGLSRVPFGLLQSLTSSDLGTAFRLQGRDVLEALRYLTGDRAVVLGGLLVTPSAEGATVAPGALLAPFAGGGVSPPREDESPTVLGRSTAQLSAALPALGVSTWYLVEARATEVDTRDTRPVFSELLGETTPTTVLVRRELGLEVRGRAGSDTVIPSAVAGWVPLGAVRRHPTGGSDPVLDVVDQRPLIAQDEPVTGTERFEAHDYALITNEETVPAAAQLRIDVSVIDRAGIRLSARGSFVLGALYEVGLTPLPSTWHYLYLSPKRGQAPDAATGKGILVLSLVAPSEQGGRANVTSIAAPNYTIAPGEATCIGALFSMGYTPDTVFGPQHCVHGRHACFHSTSSISDDEGAIDPTRIAKNARGMWTLARVEATSSSVLIFSPAGAAVPLAQATRQAYRPQENGSKPFAMPEFPLHGATVTDIEVLGLGEGGVLYLDALTW